MRRHPCVLVVAVIALLLAAPGVAVAQEDPRAQRDAARARRAQLAGELDTVRSSEAELARAAQVLQEQVRAQASAVGAARQAVAAAGAQLAQATADLDRTKAEVARLRVLVVDRAVAAYMSPVASRADRSEDTEDLAASTRRATLLASVSAKDEDAIDQLNEAEEDRALARANADAARKRAATRKAETEARLEQLEQDRANAQRVADALELRNRELLAEIEAHERNEAELTRIINARAAQQERARQQAEAQARQQREEVARQQREAAARQQREAQARQQQNREGQRPSPPPAPAATTPPPAAPSGSGESSDRSSSGCIWPARGRVTSEYGSRWGRLHAGIDIGASTGTPIWAAKDGTVIFAGEQSGYGNVVVIDHGGGMTTVYAHQSRIATRRGASVGQGETIGYVGNTGRSTGPHLHFETRYGGSPRNPRSCLP